MDLKRSTKKDARGYLLKSLCNVTGCVEITVENNWCPPDPMMINKPDHTGWLVLCELLDRIGPDLKEYVDASNKKADKE